MRLYIWVRLYLRLSAASIFLGRILDFVLHRWKVNVCHGMAAEANICPKNLHARWRWYFIFIALRRGENDSTKAALPLNTFKRPFVGWIVVVMFARLFINSTAIHCFCAGFVHCFNFHRTTDDTIFVNRLWVTKYSCLVRNHQTIANAQIKAEFFIGF